MITIGQINAEAAHIGSKPQPAPQHPEPLRSVYETFETAKAAVIDVVQKSVDEHVKLSGGHMPFIPFNWLLEAKNWTADDFASQTFRKRKDPYQKAVVLAARRYLIARDFNIFDVGEADMLWKLQNGGAQ